MLKLKIRAAPVTCHGWTVLLVHGHIVAHLPQNVPCVPMGHVGEFM